MVRQCENKKNFGKLNTCTIQLCMETRLCVYVNPLKPISSDCYMCHPGLTYIFNFLSSGTLTLSTEHQSAQT